MESFNINNFGNQNKKEEIVEGSDSWLSGPELKETPAYEDHEKSLVGHLPEGVGLDGLQFEVPIPRNHLSKEPAELDIAEAEVISPRVENIAEIILPIFKGSVSRGATDGWDNHTNSPTQKFIEVEGADIEKVVKGQGLRRDEECLVYEVIGSETSAQNEREQIVKDALLKRASRSCIN